MTHVLAALIALAVFVPLGAIAIHSAEVRRSRRRDRATPRGFYADRLDELAADADRAVV